MSNNGETPAHLRNDVDALVLAVVRLAKKVGALELAQELVAEDGDAYELAYDLLGHIEANRDEAEVEAIVEASQPPPPLDWRRDIQVYRGSGNSFYIGPRRPGTGKTAQYLRRRFG